MSYTLQTQPDGSKSLKKDGRSQYCPFQPAQMIQVPTQQRIAGGGAREMQMAQLRTECSDQCPLFQIHSLSTAEAGNTKVGFAESDVSVEIHCGTSPFEIALLAAKAQA